MDTPNAISLDEAEFQLLFEEAGLTQAPTPNTERINKVIERSMHEKAIKHTASFVFQGFPAAIMGLMAVATNSVGDKDTDYRV
ncbi:hypothetical protein MLD52_09975 [Puniceicoccaceae bacterium K14]|nr:hypothetical protein [Puniceicoccaceae bacterium K14]